MAYTGSLALRLVGVEELLARSARFRQVVGAANIQAAKERVYVGELTDVIELLASGTLDVKRPCAVIGVSEHQYVQLGQGAQIDLGVNGGVWVIFTDNAQCPTNHKDSCLDFIDWTSQTLDEVAEIVSRSVEGLEYTLWPFSGMRMFLEPIRSDVADRQAEDFWLSGYLLVDNINGGGA